MTAALTADDPTPRRTKASPATQMREMLVQSRRYGVPFEKSWDSAFARVRWPHDTEHRQEWKALLEDQRAAWEIAFEKQGDESRPLRALYSLLTAAASDERLAA